MARHVLYISIFLFSSFAYGAKYDPGPGKTNLIIGQTFQNEYQNYISGTGLTPSGSSHYATFYLGRIEQGDDNPNAAFLDWVRNNDFGEYALIAISFKDNTAAGGYGQMVDNSGSGFNPNAIWEALNDINSGRWNSQIDEFADIIRARSDTKFYLRIGYEVSLLLFAYNGNEYVVDWLNDQANAGINVFDNPDAIPQLDRQAYINAYNYVGNRIRNINNVNNVDFVYHPVRGFNDTRWLYPGSQFVDWVAFSVFNNDICLEVNGTFNCQGQSVDPNLEQSVQFALNRGKPIMVAEAAVQAPFTNTSSGFIEYLNRLDSFINRFDVRVLAYINSDWPIHGWGPEWGDSRVETRGSVLNYWQTNFGVNSRYIHSSGNTNPPSDPTPVPTPPPTSNCPASHPFECGGRCFVDEAQAASAGCTVSPNPTATPFPTSTPFPTATPQPNNCPASHPFECGGRCFVDEAQAASAGCFNTPTPTSTPTPAPTPFPTSPPGPGTNAYLAPLDNSTIMILGQDLLSVSDYNNTDAPTPGGITTYVAFYEILNDSGANGIINGALGFNTNDQPNNIDIDWGGGPLNAYNAGVGFPNSTLQIGLNIAEGNNGNIWCGGCLSQIANGQRDAEINQLADFFLAISNTPVYLRIGYEFDGLWNDGYNNIFTYQQAYRRIVDVLRQRGVSNVAYVWQSSASPIDDQIEGFFENIEQWYPGDDYVDWVGISWFLLPNELPSVGGNPATQIQLADDVLTFARSRNKAVMIAEATAQGYDLQQLTNRNISPVWDGTAAANIQGKSGQQIWNEWFAPFFSYIRQNSDVIKAVSYINADWDSQGLWDPPYPEGYWGDTRVQVNTTLFTNWKNELNSDFWTNGSADINQRVGLR